jgi:hypothetical protein
MVKGVWAAAVAIATLLIAPARVSAEPSGEAQPSASSTPPAEPSAADATASARRHFHLGVKLYRDANYKGALAEFEAAYRDKPGPGSLQNVALSLKALFRYAEAAGALRLLLSKHGEELSAPEREAMEKTVLEFEGLVGKLELQLEPAEAELSIDGRAIPREERAHAILLNVGEHTLLAEAPGFARHTQVVRVASQQELRVALRLKPVSGFLTVIASDPKAAIAIDDEPLAFHRWSGPVLPDVEHVVQIYRDGFEPFEQSVRVEVGKTVEIKGELGAASGVVDEHTPLPARPAAPPRPRGSAGYYGLVALSVVGLNDTPLNYEVSGTSANMSLPSFGLRGGYRLSDSIAVELAFDAGRLEAKGACQPNPPSAAENACWAKRDFSLRSLRFGPNLRLMTGGEKLRFATGIGVGIVSHKLEVQPATSSGSTSPDLQGGKANSVDAYFALELGAAYNYRHLLAELAVIAFIEGATGLRGAFDTDEQRAVFSDGTLPMLGLTLKVGYSSWAPKR